MTDFVLNNAGEIRKAISKIKEAHKGYKRAMNNDMTEVEQHEYFQSLEKALRVYDDINKDYVIGWITDGDVTSNEIERVGNIISNRYGTESQMVLSAIFDGVAASDKFLRRFEGK